MPCCLPRAVSGRELLFALKHIFSRFFATWLDIRGLKHFFWGSHGAICVMVVSSLLSQGWANLQVPWEPFVTHAKPRSNEERLLVHYGRSRVIYLTEGQQNFAEKTRLQHAQMPLLLSTCRKVPTKSQSGVMEAMSYPSILAVFYEETWETSWACENAVKQHYFDQCHFLFIVTPFLRVYNS